MEHVDLGVCPGRLHPGDPARVLVLLPGAWYPTAAPLLWFARAAAMRRGWTALEVWDELREGQDWAGWGGERAEAALAFAGEGARVFFVAKSLSSTAAPVAAQHRIPSVWLTPLLDEEVVVEGLGRATASSLLIGGTADPHWNRAAAPSGVEVLELEDADHSLELPGNLDGSLFYLQNVTNRIDRFLAEAA
jgi:hypothetical protein